MEARRLGSRWDAVSETLTVRSFIHTLVENSSTTTSRPVIQITLDGNSLTIADLYDAATQKSRLKLSRGSILAMKKSRALVEEWLKKNERIYGVTTGFGEFSNV